jgi:N-acetyl-gamma-glutamyl-phosphate reductase
MISATVIGGAGYVGGELIRLLLNHPSCQIDQVVSASQEGKYVYDVHKDLTGWTNLKFSSYNEEPGDVLFLCGGHGQSEEFLGKHPVSDSVCIIDLSRDYRLKRDDHNFIYGLCELNKEEIRRSKRIANCGCFATCIQLGLLPLADKHLLHDEVHITAITGSTGAGQKPVPTTHFSWRNSNISVYKAFTHQHLAEVEQSIHQLQPQFHSDINFIPMRGDFTRGIFASIYMNSELSESEAYALFKNYYATSPFVHVSSSPVGVKDVVNTNNALIHIQKHGKKLRIECIIDNLLKGASGQAVQNMNLAFGFEEYEGLRLKPSSF